MSLFQGFLVGLATVIFIGPVFFYLLSASIEFGLGGGIIVALGIIVSDLAVLLICYQGLAKLLTQEISQIWLSFIGAIILMVMGIWNIFFKKIKPATGQKATSKRRTILFTKGFLINFVNPFVFAVWIGLLSYAQSNWLDAVEGKIYISGVLIGIFSTDVTKVVLSKYLQNWLNPKRLTLLYRGIGLLMMAFGFRLVYHGSLLLSGYLSSNV